MYAYEAAAALAMVMEKGQDLINNLQDITPHFPIFPGLSRKKNLIVNALILCYLFSSLHVLVNPKSRTTNP